jgi:hypothetical protein
VDPVQEWNGIYRCTSLYGGREHERRCKLFFEINKGEGIPWNEVCAKEKDMYGATPTDEAKFS